MASQSYDPYYDWRGCVGARYYPLPSITNPDVVGITVSTAVSVATICSRIQIHLSPAGPEAGLTAIILQSYCILLSMLFCINRRQLSIFDVTHALQLVWSPLTMEVVITSIRGLFGLERRRFRQIKSHPRIMYTLGALLLPLWFGLSVTLRLSTRAFIDGELCSNPTFEDWSELLFFMIPTFSDVISWGLLFFVALSWLLRLIRVLTRQVMTNFQTQKGTSEPQGRSRTPRLFSDLTRRTIRHKYMTCTCVISDPFWAFAVIESSYRASEEEYVMSYGQLLPLFALLPFLIPTAGLCYTYRWEVFHFSHFLILTEDPDNERSFSTDCRDSCGLCKWVKHTAQSTIDHVGVVHKEYSTRFIEMLTSK